MHVLNLFSNNLKFQISLFVFIFLLIFNRGYCQSDQIIITEVNYKSDSTIDSGDWIEVHNRGDLSVDLSGWILTDMMLNQFFKIPEGIIIPSRGYFLICQDIEQFKKQYPDIINCTGSFLWSVKQKKETLNLFDSQNNLHFSFSYVDSLPWPKCADGHGRTMEIKDKNGNFNDGRNWFSGCIGGSPGREYSNCDEKIIISEINYNSSSSLDVGDWVEIRNISKEAIDVSGWKVGDKKDSAHYIIPIGTIINSGENIVVVKKVTEFKQVFPNVSKVLGSFSFSLGSDGDLVKLYNEGGRLIYSVYFNSISPWPTDALGTGKTIEILDSSLNASEGTNWIATCYGGSPGGYYSTSCMLGLGINKNMYKNEPVLYPNPVKSSFTIEFGSDEIINKESINVIFYDGIGREISGNSLKFWRENTNMNKVSIDVSNLNNGVYFYRLEQKDQDIARGRFIINY